MPVNEAYLIEDDGLAMPTVGPWAETKHRKFGYYSRMFSTSMKNKWDCRVYLDLFSGAGKARIRKEHRVIPGSPLLALTVPDAYDEYVFCEKEAANLEALRARASAAHPEAKAAFIECDSNADIATVLAAVPKFSKQKRGLTLCFVDPFNASQLRFSTLKAIASELFVDFLVLIPTYMDIHRNRDKYTRPNCRIIDEMLGDSAWRDRWPDPERPNREFGLFVAEEFCGRMKSLGFLFDDMSDLELVRMANDRNQPLYHLAFFSKNPLGLRFWRDTRKNTNTQLSLLE